MSNVIHVLSDAVANQIAAGEVIQRPASVVKELMENAVDAGATSIKVVVKDAGKTLIQVVDNGSGMSAGDAGICFERHATSKISKAEDLFAIETRGFRGEALASIAAVSEVILKTRTAEDEVGTLIRISGSIPGSTEAGQMPHGSNFQVKNLFFNLPARRKFLKSDQTELRHIINEFGHVALPNPELEFLLIHNDTEIFHLPPVNLRKRISGFLGKQTRSSLIPLETETSWIRLRGFIGKPEHAKKTYGEQFFFVNDRFIRHPYFHKAVLSGYENLLAHEQIPSYFIFFTIEPGSLDVNIHPSKTEVKFEDERSIWQILRATVREAIGRNNLSPSLDFEKEGIIDIPVLTKDTVVRVPDVETNPDYNPFREEGSYRREKQSASYQDERSAGWEQLFEPVSERRPAGTRFLQVKNKYILSPVKSGLMVIDQRRAHERIIYERMTDAGKKQQPVPQQNLFPETIRLSNADYLACMEMISKLEQLGFDIRDLGNQTVVVHGLPSGIPTSGVAGLVELMIEQYTSLNNEIDPGTDERLARSISKASSIRYGTPLTEIEMQGLVDQLFACSNPNHTPSGKSIVRIIGVEELDHFFKS